MTPSLHSATQAAAVTAMAEGLRAVTTGKENPMTIEDWIHDWIHGSDWRRVEVSRGFGDEVHATLRIGDRSVASGHGTTLTDAVSMALREYERRAIAEQARTVAR